MNSPLIKFENTEYDQTIYPVSFYESSSCNIIIWKLNTNIENYDFDKLKETIACVMDSLIDRLKEYEQYAPLIGLIDVGSFDETGLNELIGDQDWHRGRFSLQLIITDGEKSYDYYANEWQGNLQTESYEIKKIGAERFLELLTDKARVSALKGVDENQYLLFKELLIETIKNGDYGKAVSKWKEELRNQVNATLSQQLIMEDDKYENF